MTWVVPFGLMFFMWLVLVAAAVFFWRDGDREGRVLAYIYASGVILGPIVLLVLFIYA